MSEQMPEKIPDRNACAAPEFIARYRSGTVTPRQARDFDAHLLTCADCRALLREQARSAAPGLAAQILPAPEQTPHLDDAQMLAYARHTATQDERDILHAHIEHCAMCRRDVEDLLAFERQVAQFDFHALERETARPSRHERFTSFFAGFAHGVSHAGNRLLQWWHEQSVNGRLILALVFGVLAGLLLRGNAASLQIIGTVFLRVLEVAAALFIFFAIVHTILHTEITGRAARRLAYLAASNTLTAVLIGLLVGSVVQPGAGAHWPLPPQSPVVDDLRRVIREPFNVAMQSLLSNPLLLVVLAAVVIGITLRLTRQEQIEAGRDEYRVVEAFFATFYHSLTLMLKGVVMLFPLAVFAVVAWQVGRQDWHIFQILLTFSGAVLLALALHIGFYLLRLWFRASMRPREFLHGTREALLTAFSTASSLVTLPFTYNAMRHHVGVSERSAALGVLVGAHFNRDGTALYEAITPIFIAQAIGQPLTLTQQGIVAITAIFASIAAPGMPNTGLITMVLVFRAVNLPTEYILYLPIVDWFLDRCRTTVNVLGSMTITCLLDRREAPHASAADVSEAIEPEIMNAV